MDATTFYLSRDELAVSPMHWPATSAWLQAPPPPPQPPSPLPMDDLPELLRCGYASKRCENARTIKKSGGLHRFCAFHRERANRNQWRVDHRRRMLKKDVTPCCPVNAQRTKISTRHPTAPLTVDDEPACTDGFEAYCDREAMLNEQDVAILTALLFDDESPSGECHHCRVPMATVYSF